MISRHKTHYLKEIKRTTRAIAKLRNPKGVLLKANKNFSKSGILNEIVAERFDTGGRSSGRKWKALKPATIRDRLRLGFPPGPPLKRSATLKYAASLGPMRVTAERVSMRYKDGPGPKYRGRKRAPNLSVYVPSLHRVRPFYSPLGRSEQMRVNRWYAGYLQRQYDLICAGKS